MKKLFLVLFLLLCVGCASAQIPTYLQDKNPYVKRFYTDHDETLSAVLESLESLGWEIDARVDPAVYEQKEADLNDGERLLIMTKVRQTPLFLGTRYARVNIILRSKKDISEVEIRYVTVNSLPLRNVTAYRNDSAVERIFGHIIELLSGKVAE